MDISNDSVLKISKRDTDAEQACRHALRLRQKVKLCTIMSNLSLFLIVRSTDQIISKLPLFSTIYRYYVNVTVAALTK